MISAPTTELPMAREVSNWLHEEIISQPKDFKNTMMLMQFGQFVDHDISLTPEFNLEPERGENCCKDRNMSPECFPMDIPPGDHHFNNKTCLDFVRSAPYNCIPPSVQREQFNSITAYLDGSQIYGSEESMQPLLRSFEGGKLKVDDPQKYHQSQFPPTSKLSLL